MKIRFVDSIEKRWTELEDGAGKPLAPTSQPGDAYWTPDIAGNPHAALSYTCPGCGRFGSVRVGLSKEADRHQWQWDGNVSEPTLKPSLHHVGCCGWHGYLTAGEFHL